MGIEPKTIFDVDEDHFENDIIAASSQKAIAVEH